MSETLTKNPLDETTLEEVPQTELGYKPIWEIFEETVNALPAEVIAQLPEDSAEQHDHYLYGTPKRNAGWTIETGG